MSINNSAAQPDSCTSDSQAYPLTVTQCTPDFSTQLSQSVVTEANWLSIYPIVTQLVKHFIQLPQPLLICHSHYWQAAVAVIRAAANKKLPILALQNYDQQRLFGRLNLHNEQVTDFQQGEIYNLSQGCLILHISPLLVNPNLWFLLKAFLISRKIPANAAVNADKFKGQYPIEPIHALKTKVVLIANRYQLDELTQLDPEYSQVGTLFAELAGEVRASDENIQSLQHFCHALIKKRGLNDISIDAMALLFNHLATLCEHQKKILFSPEIIENLLRYAQLMTPEIALLSASALQKVLDLQSRSHSLAQDFSDQALLEKQLKIQLKGQEIGQINGMSVVELMGYPSEFGEIFRISASDMIGDGEIIDVERKVELAGNIHAKSIIIVQGYLNHFFTHITNFPFSCNVVFEQSYQESDGDSASLAILLAVTSCYSQCPIAQNLFVTGALDQHGNVLAIGGINQKIQAVTRLFKLGLLMETVTILIPQANRINLTLGAQTLQLISEKKLNIYAINHCQEAFPLAMNLTFENVIQTINQRIDELHKEGSDEPQASFLTKCTGWFR